MKQRTKQLELKYKVAIIISLIIGVSILIYGYMNYKYKKEALEQQIRVTEQARIEKESKEQSESISNTAKQIQLQTCLDDVNQRASKALEENKNMNVSVEGSKIIIDFIQKLRDECFKKYPQN